MIRAKYCKFHFERVAKAEGERGSWKNKALESEAERDTWKNKFLELEAELQSLKRTHELEQTGEAKKAKHT